MPRAWCDLSFSILLTGSELVEGRLQDTNSLFIARFLFERGQRLKQVMICDDDEVEIEKCLKFLSQSSDVILTSGGLGPTTGDRTRQAIANFLGVDLILDPASLDKIKKFFEERKRVYENNNDKQALIPKTGNVLENNYGTATCFSAPFSKDNATQGIICALPGVPRELEKLIPEKVIPAVLQYFKINSFEEQVPLLYPFRVFGLGESTIGARIVESQPDSRVEVSYRATFPEVQVLFRAKDSSLTKAELEFQATKAIEKIGKDFVFAQGVNQSLIENIHNLCLDRELLLSLAESCTGGMLGSLITSQADCSKYFLGSFVTYSNQLKQEVLNIPEQVILDNGAVSAKVAEYMAKAARNAALSKLSISITGIAGPGGGSSEKPIGTCYLGISDKNGGLTARINFPGSRERVRRYASYAALDLIRRRVLGLPIALPVFTEVQEFS